MKYNHHFARANSSADYFNAENQDIYHLTLAALAVAYEQRTANLIAVYSMTEENCGALNTQAAMGPEAWSSIAVQIIERLGLK